MSTPAFALKSTQIVAAVAVVIALLGGAYAVGRSQTADTAPVADAVPRTALHDEQTPPRVAEARPQRLASANRQADSGYGLGAAPDPETKALARLCDSCGLVTDVHTEARRGEGSGVGAVGGAVVGGLLGNMIGGGTGRKLATVGGAVAGGYAGNEIEKNEKTHSVWVVQVKERDGRLRRFERSADPGLRVGDEVSLHDGTFSPR
jgi:uncharacterized protein YcfJ